jgi:hypothetical protein
MTDRLSRAELIERMAQAYLTALAPGGFRDLDAAVLRRFWAMSAALSVVEKHGLPERVK